MKILGAIVLLYCLVYVVYPSVHRHIALKYFNKKCSEDAGDFIYETVNDVDGFFLMRLRDPRDLYSRLRKRDVPEDPFNHTNFESQQAEYLFVSPPYRNYEYIEMPWRDFRYTYNPFKKIVTDIPKSRYIKFYGNRQTSTESSAFVASPMQLTGVDKPTSRYGVTWRGFRSNWDKFFGVWGGEVIVSDLENSEILGLRRGYFFYPFSSTVVRLCPREYSAEQMTYRFVSKILKPKAKGVDNE